MNNLRMFVAGAAVALMAICLSVEGADEDRWLRPLSVPRKAKPSTQSGGELSKPPPGGAVPAPLATPQRRTENKRAPSPPKILTKVVWGERVSFTRGAGEATEVSDWNQCPSDIGGLMSHLKTDVEAQYSTETATLDSFHGDPDKTPVLFFSGSRSIRLDDRQVNQLREYVTKGGMIVFDSIYGSPHFYESSKEAAKRLFPDLMLRTVPSDHPLLHINHSVVRSQKLGGDAKITRPKFDAVYVGSRIGVLISRWGLGAGWIGSDITTMKHTLGDLYNESGFYDNESAKRLGVNILAYAIGYRQVAREESKPELVGTYTHQSPTDEFVFAQIRHDGAWNVHPGAASSLLRQVKTGTAMNVSLKRLAVNLEHDDLSDLPFLYLSGLDTFRFSAKEKEVLRKFVNNNGILFINNGLGMNTFDRSVRQQLRITFPGSKLEPIPENHPILNCGYEIREAAYTRHARIADGSGGLPQLYGITIDDEIRVIYSPYDIEAGWLGIDYPLSKGYEATSAMQLGINLIIYAMTH